MRGKQTRREQKVTSKLDWIISRDFNFTQRYLQKNSKKERSELLPDRIESESNDENGGGRG